MSIRAVQVSDLPLAAVFSRISSATAGFNPLFRQQAQVYGIPPTYAQFNFADGTTNFMFGQVNPDQLEQTGNIQYPFACLYVLESGQTNDQKFTTFSGMVRIIFDVFLSWGSTAGIYNFEKYVNCVESVVVSIMNEEPNQNWGKPLVYNGGIQCRRGPLTFSGQNWRQKVGFSIMLGVHE